MYLCLCVCVCVLCGCIYCNVCMWVSMILCWYGWNYLDVFYMLLCLYQVCFYYMHKHIYDIHTYIDKHSHSHTYIYRSRTLIRLYIPWVSNIPIEQGNSWKPTWKAAPNIKVSEDALYPKYWGKLIKPTFCTLTYELSAFGTMLQHEHALGIEPKVY